MSMVRSSMVELASMASAARTSSRIFSVSGRPLEAVELAGVVSHDPCLGLRTERTHLLGNALDRRRVETGRVWKIGFEQDPIVTDDVHDVLQLAVTLFEPEGRIPMLGEVFGGLPLHRLEVIGGVLGELVVHGLEDERDPADATLDGDHGEVGEPVEHAGKDRVHHYTGAVEEEHGATDGRLDVLVLRLPEVVAEEIHG